MSAGSSRGDLGTSYITRRPILGDLLQRFPATLQLAGAAMLFAAVIGIAIGIYGAWRPGSWPDRLAAFGAYLGVSFPVYWVGLLLILVFAVGAPVAAAVGRARPALPHPAGSHARHALGRVPVAHDPRRDAGGAPERFRADGAGQGARAKARVVLRHAFRNALLPVVTVLGLDFGSYLTGSILTETIFSWPGVGRYVLTAIDKRDLPAVQGSILFLSLVFVLVNLLTDVLYARVDPRVAYD